MTCKKEFVRIMYTVICMNMQKLIILYINIQKILALKTVVNIKIF